MLDGCFRQGNAFLSLYVFITQEGVFHMALWDFAGLFEPFAYRVPINDAPQLVDVVGTAVLVIEIVGMFPHVESE